MRTTQEPPNTGMELVELEQGWEGNFIHWMDVVDTVLKRFFIKNNSWKQ
jgi:hypothetical protein